jgi:hypothetical protein
MIRKGRIEKMKSKKRRRRMEVIWELNFLEGMTEK